jgi:2-desacetyl-2-hydroxyethyl bacteriochlorophyllide A dehydrogenase
MKAYVLNKIGHPLEEVEMPVPHPSDSEVLIKVKAAGICGSDLHVIKGSRSVRLPIILGHECAGVVEEIGSNVKDVNVGERVSLWYTIPCNVCDTCLRGMHNACPNRRSIGGDVNGCYAEYVVVPSSNVLKLPPEVSFEIAAIIGCSVSTAFHAVRIASIELGDDIVIYGLGGVGLHVAMLSKMMGAKTIIGIDLNPNKEKIAKDFGVDYFLNPNDTDVKKEILYLTNLNGADKVFECVGSPESLSMMTQIVKPAGKIIFVGLNMASTTFEPFPLLYKEAKILFSVNHTLEEQKRLINLAKRGLIDLSNSITYKMPLHKINEALHLLQTQKTNIVKIVLLP